MSVKSFLTVALIVFLFACKDERKNAELHKNQNDSLEFYLRESNIDSLALEKRYKYAKRAEEIVLQGENDSLHRVNLFRVANRYWNMENFEAYKKITFQTIKNANLAKDTTSTTKALQYMADYYMKKRAVDSVYWYNNQIIKIYKNSKDYLNISKTLWSKALFQYEFSDYLGAERSVFELLKNLRNNDNKEISYQCYNLLGIIYGEFKEYKLSKEYYDLALYIIKIDPMKPEFQFKATTLNNIGCLLSDQKRYFEALSFYKLALKQENLSKDRPLIFSLVIDNLAYTQFKLGRLNDSSAFFKALKITDSINYYPGIILNKIHLSEYYAYTKDTTQAFFFASEANHLAKEKREVKSQLNTLKQLTNVDPKNALTYSTEYIKINDSLQLAERKIRNKFARIEYETEELEIKNKQLTEQRSNIIYLSSFLLLILATFLLIRHQIGKNKELKFLQIQQNANEEIYKLMLNQQQKIEEGKQIEKKRISQELHDGVMGRLTSIRLNLFVLSKKTDPETIQKCLDHITEIQDVEKEIKTIAYDLGKSLFSDKINFETIVKNIFKAIENHSEINFKLYVDENIKWEEINSADKIQIYRILQESLQNIDKYSEAKNVIISMKKSQDAITIDISDDGVGFNKKKVKRGFGLKNMKLRAKELKGKIRIDSELGTGTRINLTIPIK